MLNNKMKSIVLGKFLGLIVCWVIVITLFHLYTLTSDVFIQNLFIGVMICLFVIFMYFFINIFYILMPMLWASGLTRVHFGRHYLIDRSLSDYFREFIEGDGKGKR